MSESFTIHKAGAAITRGGHLLVVRKHLQESPAYIMVGGKLNPNESPEDALIREVHEELSVAVTSHEHIGTFRDIAELEEVSILLYAYVVTVDGDPSPTGEIAEMKWFDRYELLRAPLASILRRRVVPLLIRRGLV